MELNLFTAIDAYIRSDRNFDMAEQNNDPETSNEPTQDDSYDPYSNRDTQKAVSDFGSLANLVKSAAGTGLFAMPNAFACVGLFIGLIGTALMGLLIAGSLQFLVRIHHTMCIRTQRPLLTYDEVVVASLTRSGKKAWVSPECATFIVDVIMLTCYIGIGAVYIVFISGIVQECVDFKKTIGQNYYALLLFPLFLIMNMAKNLRDIAPISVVGNILLFSAGVIGIVYALKDGIGDSWSMIGPDMSLYPKFLGTVFFSMCSPGVVLAIEHSMKKPWNYTKFCGVLNWGMLFLVVLHMFVGAVGYVRWGSGSLGNFIRNHEENDGPTLAALVMQALAIYFTYGLQCYMPITILHKEYATPSIAEGQWKGSHFLWDLLIRFTVTLVTCVLAAAIPKLDLFTGLVGAICISTLASLIPVTMYILVHYGNFGRFKWRLILGSFMLTVAFVAGLCAVITNLTLLVRYFEYGD